MSTEATAGAPWWHVVWTTYLSWPPSDPRGDWRDLAALYEQLRREGRSVTMSAPLPQRWQDRPAPAGQVVLSSSACDQVAADVRELTATDRVAGDTPVCTLAVTPTCVQAVLSCPVADLRRRVGRLKSRTATLLSFRAELGVGGAGTWSRGFWRACLHSEDSVSQVSAFVSARGGPPGRERLSPGGGGSVTP